MLIIFVIKLLSSMVLRIKLVDSMKIRVKYKQTMSFQEINLVKIAKKHLMHTSSSWLWSLIDRRHNGDLTMKMLISKTFQSLLLHYSFLHEDVKLIFWEELTKELYIKIFLKWRWFSFVCFFLVVNKNIGKLLYLLLVNASNCKYQ